MIDIINYINNNIIPNSIIEKDKIDVNDLSTIFI